MGWVYAKSNSLGLANQPTIFGLQVTESPNQRDFSSKGFLWAHVIRVWKCLQNTGKVWKCLQAQLEPRARVMLSAVILCLSSQIPSVVASLLGRLVQDDGLRPLWASVLISESSSGNRFSFSAISGKGCH